jgi:hypothetical protein
LKEENEKILREMNSLNDSLKKDLKIKEKKIESIKSDFEKN